jgi:hypothetical protein
MLAQRETKIIKSKILLPILYIIQTFDHHEVMALSYKYRGSPGDVPVVLKERMDDHSTTHYECSFFLVREPEDVSRIQH